MGFSLFSKGSTFFKRRLQHHPLPERDSFLPGEAARSVGRCPRKGGVNSSLGKGDVSSHSGEKKTELEASRRSFRRAGGKGKKKRSDCRKKKRRSAASAVTGKWGNTKQMRIFPLRNTPQRNRGENRAKAKPSRCKEIVGLINL